MDVVSPAALSKSKSLGSAGRIDIGALEDAINNNDYSTRSGRIAEKLAQKEAIEKVVTVVESFKSKLVRRLAAATTGALIVIELRKRAK